ncbi:MAG: translocation/assembly module TamB domain-containing protein [Prevotellaceae bacterium]|jgi:translocation and assembly module TamB|nr:translocation/assembly module TamB domain-containing protein [Prevotellaceae bacterium]
MNLLKQLIKVTAWLLIGIIALLATVLIVIQTPFGKRQIVNIAQRQVNNFLNAELHIGRLQGNYFSDITLSDILLLSQERDTIGFIPEISLRYRLRPLLDRKIEIKNITIESPFLYLEELPDGSWNVMHLTPPSDDKDTTDTHVDFLINLRQFRLNNGKLKIASSGEMIPKELHRLFIELSGRYSDESQYLRLDSLSFVAENPDLTLKHLSASVSADNNAVNIPDLSLQTAGNNLKINGRYTFAETAPSFVNIAASAICPDEFTDLLPDAFRLDAHPDINLNVRLENKNLYADLSLRDNRQALDAKLLTQQLSDYFADSAAQIPVAYKLDIHLKEIDARHWIGPVGANYFADGKLTVEGKGFDPKTLHATLHADFNSLHVDNYALRQLHVDLNYRAGNVSGHAKGNSDAGDVEITPDIRSILSNNPSYNISMSVRELNLAPIIRDTTYNSRLNLDARIIGSGLNPDKTNAQGQISLRPSEITGIRVDTIFSTLRFINQNVIIDTLFIHALAAGASAKGNFHLDGASDLRLQVGIEDISEIAALAGIDSLETSLSLDAHLTGLTDSLKVDIRLNADKTTYGDYLLKSLSTRASAAIFNLGDSICANADAWAHDISIGDFAIDSLTLSASTDTKDIDIRLQADNKDLSAKLKTLINLDSIVTIALSDLRLDYKTLKWQLGIDTTKIHLSENDCIIDSLILLSTAADSLQTILLDGKISRKNDQQLTLQVSNISIPELLKVTGSDYDIQGLFTLNLDIDGPPDNPFISGGFEIKDASVEQVAIDFFASDIIFMDKDLMLTFNIIPQDSGAITAVGKLPMEIRPDSLHFLIIPRNDDPVNLSLNIDRLPLSIINTFYPLDDIKGYIKTKIVLDGTFGAPRLIGNIRLLDGKLRLNKYGIDYRDILGTINFNTDHVKIDQFYIRSKDGRMTIDGKLDFDSEIYNGIIKTSELNLLFSRFNPVDHRYYNMELSGNIHLRGDKDSIRFGGDIQIPESQFYLPAVMNLMGAPTASEPPTPLLLRQSDREPHISTPDSIVRTIKPDSLTFELNRLAFLDNAKGKIRIKIPRNTWIRNEELRIELSGDVELLKHRDFFEIFGTVDVIRGQYNMLGKVFIIRSGIVTFQGGPTIDPQLNIDAMYSFRDNDRTKKDMTILITGQVSSPEIKFMLDQSQISEGDALSYILFGTSMDALTSGQQASLGGSFGTSNLAETLAASLISSQLTRLLGKTLNVDYIEFKAGSTFDSATFTVGKYITNKLFVGYEQNIGQLANDDVARYEMKMEYELFKFLFLQLTSSPLTSGFDLIFKFDSKTK